ncbi:MAG: GNAT family N-acetyltransferase [Campylobacterota bacterium]|nr:GNAT family N-acetyltransferase [Campylobacterota bacterium]
MTLSYKTTKLSAYELLTDTQEREIFTAVIELLTPEVVKHLPPYFSNITSITKAKEWVKHMLSQSRLIIIKQTNTDRIIGFVFLSKEDETTLHIGYLLGTSYWGKGYATELLKGLIDFLTYENRIKRLIAGVSISNIESCKLLKKLNFIKSDSDDNETLFYEYQLQKNSK